jgi:pre-mRNA-splicing factor CDC5/CEF1
LFVLIRDAAQEQGGADAEAKDDPRKLRQGEIDPAPESRVPRPDPIDMDEDEKEMLNEARARLANTKGKKAKRKAREKQLMEAKRLASLQKRRELKAAGIESRFVFKKKNQMNYNAEIPFEKLPQGGFYDISEEVEAEKRMRHDPNFLNKTLHELDGKRRADIEEEARKKDAKRQKLMKEFMLPQYIMQIHKQTDPNAQVARPKLSLPAPNISDSDLQEIAKINAQGGLAASAGATPTRALLATYGGGSATPSASSTGIFGGMGARTPMALPTPQRTAATGDALMAEARAQLAMTQRSTPLVGGEMPEMAFGNAVTTGRVPAKTPQMGATPRLGMTPQTFGSAPATPSGSWESSEKGSQAAAADSGATLALKRRQASMKSALFSGLSALPAPRNEAVLAAPVPMDEEDTQAKVLTVFVLVNSVIFCAHWFFIIPFSPKWKRTPLRLQHAHAPPHRPPKRLAWLVVPPCCVASCRAQPVWPIMPGPRDRRWPCSWATKTRSWCWLNVARRLSLFARRWRVCCNAMRCSTRWQARRR